MPIRIFRRSLSYVVLAVFISSAGGGEQISVLWRYSVDRYNNAVLTDPITVPAGTDPYTSLAEHLGYRVWHHRNSGDITIISEKAVEGTVPILCFHKLSREDDYALTPDRFRALLRYISSEGWYPVSDRQYLEGDFSRVPTGLKPIVLGSDDASHGNMIYQTKGDRLTGQVKRLLGQPVPERDSMVAILERMAPREGGRINFTFYISFDAVPFRQLDGFENPGFPYRGVPVIAEKVQYLDENFILGIHSLSHLAATEMGPEAFGKDVLAAWELIDEYAGGKAESLSTMAFPYGIKSLTPELRQVLTSLNRNGEHLAGVFDFNNKLAPPPGNPGDIFKVPRLNADNRNWNSLMSTLKSADAVTARREFIWMVDSKRLPASRYVLGASAEDGIWVLVTPETDI